MNILSAKESSWLLYPREFLVFQFIWLQKKISHIKHATSCRILLLLPPTLLTSHPLVLKLPTAGVHETNIAYEQPQNYATTKNNICENVPPKNPITTFMLILLAYCLG
jgi:hypothetical protein